ncbi:hypothetical protein [Actinomycetospora cinnamomea]|uniref:hypothetical protein n=1 Tax=Actinomycetospora cinnamomea TaxID=663609 RepID=UPI001A9C9882|nr:hypothetical protein [Actinomycetospora cinnamomea]
MIDLDIEKFFDSVPWDLVVKAVKAHTDQRWLVLYVTRWLQAPVHARDGTITFRDSNDQDDKSPVTRDRHAGICGSPGVRFPRATRHLARPSDNDAHPHDHPEELPGGGRRRPPTNDHPPATTRP